MPGESSAAEKLPDKGLDFEAKEPKKPILEVIEGEKKDEGMTEEERNELRSKIMTNETRNMLLGHIKRFGFDEDETNTIVNDTMLKGDAAFDNAILKRPESLNAWLKRIATNKSLDFKRSKKIKREVFDSTGRDDEDKEGRIARLASEDASPEEMMEGLEDDLRALEKVGKEKKFLQKFIGQLNEKQREVIELTLKGMDRSEIAKRLDISELAVSSRLTHAVKNLRKIMEEKGIEKREDVKVA
jgi:RNA polymerase sigma factor (sigma-70 family)